MKFLAQIFCRHGQDYSKVYTLSVGLIIIKWEEPFYPALKPPIVTVTETVGTDRDTQTTGKE